MTKKWVETREGGQQKSCFRGERKKECVCGSIKPTSSYWATYSGCIEWSSWHYLHKVWSVLPEICTGRPAIHTYSSDIHSSICQCKCWEWRWKLADCSAPSQRDMKGSVWESAGRAHTSQPCGPRQPLSNYCRPSQALLRHALNFAQDRWGPAEYAAESSVPTANRCRLRG